MQVLKILNYWCPDNRLVIFHKNFQMIRNICFGEPEKHPTQVLFLESRLSDGDGLFELSSRYLK